MRITEAAISTSSRGPPRLAAVPSPLPADELPVPPAKRVRADQEAGPRLSREEESGRCQHCPVHRPESEPPAPLPGQHLDLVAQDSQLEVALAVVAAGQLADQAAEEPVGQRPQHRGQSPTTGPS